MLEYDRIIKYHVTSKCDGPLHIGSSIGDKEEVLIHPVKNIPFIQASSIAGMLRALYQSSHTVAETEMLFGSSKEGDDATAGSRLIFTDGIFDVNTVKMELRPHVKINRMTGCVDSANRSGQKYNMEYIGAGASFEFDLYLYEDSRNAVMQQDMMELLSVLYKGNVQIGAKKSNGVGFIRAANVQYCVFDLRKKEGRDYWRSEVCDYKDLTQELLSYKDTSNIQYDISVLGKTEGFIQVKGIGSSGTGKDAPKSENMKDASGNYIIPGSSLKGAIRSQVENIAGYLGIENQIDGLFGTGNQSYTEGKRGNLVFRDTQIGDAESIDNMPLSHRIHINKFTGSVFQGGLFTEKNAAGNICLSILVCKNNNPEIALGLLLLALRDLAAGIVNLGNGYAIGKGIIKVDAIKVYAVTGEKAELSFVDKKISDPNGIVKRALKALKDSKGV